MRQSTQEAASKRDTLLHSVLSSDPTKLFKAVRSTKQSSTPALHHLEVGGQTYTGDRVPDGFFNALTALKVPDPTTFSSNPSFLSAQESYRHILEICWAGPPIPPISEAQAQKLLEELRPHVKDFFSISAHHYLAAGTHGIRHFSHLLNILITDLNTTAIPELNSAWAIMLHKGHGKPQSFFKILALHLHLPPPCKGPQPEGCRYAEGELKCCCPFHSVYGQRQLP